MASKREHGVDGGGRHSGDSSWYSTKYHRILVTYNSIKLGHFLGQIYIQPVETGQQKHQEHLRYEAYHYEFLQE